MTRIVGRLSDSYLLLRGETIARHETMQALAKSRDDAIRQAVAEGKVDAEDHHEDLAQRRRRPGAPARTSMVRSATRRSRSTSRSSARRALLCAIRIDLAAPTSETLGCRCWVEYKMDFFARVVARYKASRQ